MKPSHRTLAMLACVATSLVADPSRADGVQELVRLDDGSELQGTLVEKVPGDHVTIVLATGSVHTIAWDEIISAETTSASSTTTSGATPTGTPNEASTVVVSDMPEPSDAPQTFRGGRLLYGVGTGVGTPTGYLGALVGWDPTRWLEIEGGVGLGGKFGWGVGGGLRVNTPFLETMRYGFGVGVSENFLSQSARARDGDDPGAPPTARFLNVDFSQDYSLGADAFMRFTVGFAFLLNASDYTAMCAGANAQTTDCEWAMSLPSTPKTAAERAKNGARLYLPYFGLELLWFA